MHELLHPTVYVDEVTQPCPNPMLISNLKEVPATDTLELVPADGLIDEIDFSNDASLIFASARLLSYPSEWALSGSHIPGIFALPIIGKCPMLPQAFFQEKYIIVYACYGCVRGIFRVFFLRNNSYKRVPLRQYIDCIQHMYLINHHRAAIEVATAIDKFIFIFCILD